MEKAERKAVQFLSRGFQTTRPVNRLEDGKFVVLTDVRSYQDGIIMTRPGQVALTSVATDTPLHSIGRLNADAPSAAQADALIVGAGTKLYTSNAAMTVLTQRDTGYSGGYLSMVPHRPTQSPEPWMYVADSSRMRKVRVNGDNYPIGIAPPNTAPSASIAAPIRTTISDFEAAGAWTNAGDAGAIAVASRLTGATTITRIVYDSGTTGLATVQPSVLDDNIQAGMFLIVDAGGTPETIVVERVYRSIVNTTIARIVYDSGNTGACTIQVTTPSVGLERDALVLINSGGGSAEAVRILSVTEGPDGFASIRTVCANNHAAAETVDGLGCIRAYFTANHAAGQTLTTNKFRSTITFATGIGYLNLVSAFSLTTSNSRPVQPDDEIHISIRVDDPSRLLEARVMFDVDANTNDFTRNYYYYSITANALTQALQNTVTTATATQRIAAQNQLNDYYQRGQGSRLNDYYETRPGRRVYLTEDSEIDTRNYLQLPDPNPEYLPPETTPGNNQWTEIVFKVRDLIRVGADESRTLKNVAAIRIQFQISNTIVADIDAWWIGGTYGPDASAGSPYFYCYTARNKATGAVSNPSPPMRSGMLPCRQRISGTLTQHTDTQVDLLDVYRIGGSLNEWHYVLTTANGATPTFTDDYPDDVIAGNPLLEEDNFQPFPSTDVPRTGTCNAAGTKIRWRSGDIFNASWGRNSLIRINGIAYTLYSQPTVTALTVSNATNATPIVITTTTNHGLNTGDGVRIAGVLGNTAANGDWVVTPTGATTFSLDTSVGNGAYTSGGTATKYDLETNENVGNLANVSLEIPDALLLGQPLPVMWGPYGGGLGGVFMFACGDPRLPGVLFITKGNNPDSSFYRLEITSGSEELVSGCIYDGRCYVFSTKRMYSVEPINGGQDWVAREVANSIGLQSRWGLCVGDHIYFVGISGVYQSDGGQPTSLTDNAFEDAFLLDASIPSSVMDGVSGITKIYTASQYRLDFANNFLFLDYKVGVSFFNLVYDIKRRIWSEDVYFRQAVTHFGCDLQPSNQSLITIIGASNGKLYKLDSSVTQDDGAAIGPEVYTGFLDCDDPRANKMFQDIYLDLISPTAVSIHAHLNNTYNTAAVQTLTSAVTTARSAQTFDLNNGSGYLGRSIGLHFAWTHLTSTAPVILYEYHFSYYPKGERTALRATDWDDLGRFGPKWLQGLSIRADTFGAAKSFSVQTDDFQTSGPYSITHNGERVADVSLNTPLIANLFRLTTTDSDEWMLLDMEWVFEPEPRQAEEWIAQPNTFGIDGFKLLGPTAYIAHRSFADLTLAIDVDGSIKSFTVPHSSGIFTVSRVVLSADLKGRTFQPKVTSSTAFRLYGEGCKFGVKPWNGKAFAIVRPFGEAAPDSEARI